MPVSWLGVVYGTAFVCGPSGANGSGGLFQFPLQDGQADLINQTVQGDSQSGQCADPLQDAKGTIQIPPGAYAPIGNLDNVSRSENPSPSRTTRGKATNPRTTMQ